MKRQDKGRAGSWFWTIAFGLLLVGAGAAAAQPVLPVVTEAGTGAVPASVPAAAVVVATDPVLDPVQAARLEAARRGREAALRELAAERARMVAYAGSLTAVQQHLDGAGARHAVDQEAALGLVQQALEARADPAAADRVYDDLRLELRATRLHLGARLDALGGMVALPAPPSEVRADLAPAADRAAVQSLRLSLIRQRAQLAERLEESNRAEASLLLTRITDLNQARLDLLGHLSDPKQRETTGFTRAGWSQATAELGHLLLIIRYHASVLVAVLGADGSMDHLLTGAAGLAMSAALWLVVLVGFAIWRSSANRLLPHWEALLVDRNRAALRATPDVGLGALRVLIAVRGPLEWLILLQVLLAVLPPHIQALLEVEIISLILRWVLIAAVSSRLLDALLSMGHPRLSRRSQELGPLRLRSMRLVANMVVGFILLLALTAKLVGKGAIYNWVASTCWIAALPVGFVLVAWWRGVVFDRLERQRRPDALQRWALASRTGRLGPLAALVGALDVGVRATGRTLRTVGSRFVSVRRLLAFVFRQELNRADQTSVADLAALPAEAGQSLSPDAHGQTWITTRLDPALETLIAKGSGGVVALVGERGAGKSAALSRLAARFGDARRTTASELMQPGPAYRAGSPSSAPKVVLVDEVEALVRFDVDGLTALDALLERTRTTADRTLWVLAIDAAAWVLVSNLREPRTLFSSVIEIPHWPDTAIAELLHSRAGEAGLNPGYDRMIGDVGDMDDTDRLDLVEAKSTAFMLMLWDSSGGNPGVALQLWRSALGVASDGAVFVRPLRPVTEAVIERLPLEALFVYRAVLRSPGLEEAEIATAVRLPLSRVRDILGSGVSEGHIETQGDGYRVGWDWYRALTRSLVRRHLGNAS